MFRITVIVVSGFLLLGSSRSQTQAGLSAELDAVFAATMHEDGPGGSVLIQRGDKTLYRKSIGFANLGTRERFTEKTVANLGSISKTFVGYGILLLRDEGRLSLEDSLIKFFPDFRNREIAGRITLRHLLTHTSGIKDFINEPTVDMRKDIQPEDVIESLREKPLNYFQPGEKLQKR